MREKDKDPMRLDHMLEAMDNVLEFTEGVAYEDFRRDKMLRYAVVKNLEIVGEAAYMLTKEFLEEHTEVAWDPIIKMRHILVHDYFQVDDAIVWHTIQHDLHPLRKQITQYRKEIK